MTISAKTMYRIHHSRATVVEKRPVIRCTNRYVTFTCKVQEGEAPVEHTEKKIAETHAWYETFEEARDALRRRAAMALSLAERKVAEARFICKFVQDMDSAKDIR